MRREYIWALVTLIIAIALAFILISLTNDPQAGGETVGSVASKWDDQIDELEKAALGEAFKKHIAQLYSIWVTDNYQPKIPPKALVGARNARDAYVRSMEAIEKRREK